MPQKTWVIGEEVLAADFNAFLQQQVVPQFATPAERDSQWTAPPNGAMAVTVDTYSVWQRRAGAWVPYLPDQRRVGCSLTVTNQAIASATTGNLIWSTEVYDPDGFHAPSATVIQVPAGLGGIYLVSVQVDANGTLNGVSSVSVNWTGGLPITAVVPIGQRYMAVSGAVEAAAGVGFNTAVLNGHSGSVNFSARVNVTRVSV